MPAEVIRGKTSMTASTSEPRIKPSRSMVSISSSMTLSLSSSSTASASMYMTERLYSAKTIQPRTKGCNAHTPSSACVHFTEHPRTLKNIMRTLQKTVPPGNI